MSRGASQIVIMNINFGYDAHARRVDPGLHPGLAGLCGGEARGRGRAGTEDSRREAGVEREPAWPFTESDGGGAEGAGGRELVSGRGKQASAGRAGGTIRRKDGRGCCWSG